jgi:hypothetical protein
VEWKNTKKPFKGSQKREYNKLDLMLFATEI